MRNTSRRGPSDSSLCLRKALGSSVLLTCGLKRSPHSCRISSEHREHTYFSINWFRNSITVAFYFVDEAAAHEKDSLAFGFCCFSLCCTLLKMRMRSQTKKNERMSRTKPELDVNSSEMERSDFYAQKSKQVIRVRSSLVLQVAEESTKVTKDVTLLTKGAPKNLLSKGDLLFTEIWNWSTKNIQRKANKTFLASSSCSPETRKRKLYEKAATEVRRNINYPSKVSLIHSSFPTHHPTRVHGSFLHKFLLIN